MITERDIRTSDGRTLHTYDTGGGSDDGLTVMWHHGTPNIGAPPEPLFSPDLRWVGYDRPSYAGSSELPDRDIASAAADVRTVAEVLELERFAVMGHSGGSPHALACGALLPGHVVGVVAVASLAPYNADGLDWFAGMIPSGVASLSAAAKGRGAKEHFEASGADYDPEFTAADIAALQGEWGWLGSVVGPATASGPGGLVADDLAYTRDWGFDPAAVEVPVLLLHGEDDGIAPPAHAQWLAARIPGAELHRFAGEGHISVLTHASDGLDWLRGITVRRGA